MLTFIKLGGSLITDKRESQRFQADVMQRAAAEIAATCAARPELRLLIGHGSGSFGHVAAQKHGTMRGVRTAAEWRGFAEVSVIARRLNALVIDALHEAGLPVIGFQPSASAKCDDGRLVMMDYAPIAEALRVGLIPVVHGDVAMDAVRGGTIISTEAIFSYLAVYLRPARILLLGEVEGVYTLEGTIIPRITPGSFEQIAAALRGSHGIDVTGGMASKVRDMLDLVKRVPGLEIRILGGTAPGQLEAALRGESEVGTLLTLDEPSGAGSSRAYERYVPLRLNTARELDAIQAVSQVMATGANLDDLLQLIIDKLVEAIDAERGTLYLVDEARGELYSKVLLENRKTLSEIRVKIGTGIAGHVAATGEVLNVAHAYSDPRFNRNFDQVSGFRTDSILTAPMRNPQQKIIGVVQVINKRGGQPFSESDERLLSSMAAQAAISIENARLYAQEIEQRLIQSELRTAKSIQESILPAALPQRPDWQIGAYWQPAQNVAGDFYDVQELGDGRCAFLIADVSGKGIPAALFMALSVTVLRIAITLKFDPSDLMRYTNRALVSFNPQSKMFASIFIGYLDFVSGTMQCVSAGHNPPLLYRAAAHTCEFVRIPGVIAGMFDNLEYAPRTLALEPGDILVLYTDGITEAQNMQGDLFGEARLAELVREKHTLTAQALVSALIEAVGSFSGERGAFDDETLVIIKRV